MTLSMAGGGVATSTAAPDQAGRVRACLITLGGEVFAVDLRFVKEVVVLEELTTVPRAPSYLVGVANLRGDILPVLEIRPLLGLSPIGIGHGTRALVVAAASLRVAVAVDGVVGLEAFDEILPIGELARKECRALGVGLLGREADGPVTLLSIAKILDALRVGVPAAPSGGAP